MKLPAPAHTREKPSQPEKLRLVTDFRRIFEKVMKDVNKFLTEKDVWQNVREDSNVFCKLVACIKQVDNIMGQACDYTSLTADLR